MTKRVANQKINILRDFCILDKKDKEKVEATKALLLQCTEYEAERFFRDILMGIYTLEELLMRKELA